ncbi:hypothetical protein BST45_02995 [Mycobacterium shinjukuense]|uniref:Nickel/cobalt efflux system n=1 Tax=Mycobacterium shinjukuense TaxID=398694 RepID=A0A7I7MSS1_9MYCO|nr:hypothetical protein BST45_02995 [Mycobacterium shinjukuense]BBX74299.1 hypothetical protein MSHI_22050 [Mycobacterium shinjukuense]
MCLLDTIDGSFMNCADGWAFSSPVRRIYYNITITGLSVAVAFVIGSAELLGGRRVPDQGHGGRTVGLRHHGGGDAQRHRAGAAEAL